MIRALWTAASGMETQQTNMDVISNNLANVNTAGFKKSRPDFQDLLYQNVAMPGAATADTENPTGIQIGLGSRTAAVQRIFSVGNMISTDNGYDIAIQGDGFFQIEVPNGETVYTRCGAFKRDSTGRLVTSDGYPLTPQITIPENATSVRIGEDGTVTVYLDNDATNGSQIGNIELALFSNPAGLNSIGRNFYRETVTSGAPTLGTPGENGLGTLAQNYLEGSNVSVMEEMVNMIAGQRAYEVNSKAITTSDEMLQIVNNMA